MIDEKDWRGTRPWVGPKAIRYHSQAKASPTTVVASSGLQAHGNVMQALRACWSCVVERPANPGTRKVVVLDDLPKKSSSKEDALFASKSLGLIILDCLRFLLIDFIM